MRLVVSEKARDDLNGIGEWIATDSPPAAVRVIRRLRERVEMLVEPGLAGIGRPGSSPGTRELVEQPYIIVYEIHEDRDEVIVLAVFHGARDR